MRIYAKLSTPLLLLMLFTGCMVGPNYKAPATKLPQTFSTGNATPVQPELSTWWKEFQDPLLESLMERAVKQNLDLKLAQARVREARALRGVTGADLYPNVDATASYQRLKTSENAVPTAATNYSTTFNGNMFQAGFDASWELDVFGGTRRSIEAADADVAAEIENRRQVLVSLLAEVARNYVDLRAYQRRMAIARANLSAQQDTLELTRVRFNAGLASDLDVARAEAQVQNTAAQIPIFEAASRQTMHQLSVLLALEPDSLDSELVAEAPIPAAPKEVPAGLPSDLLRRRPDVRRAERQLAGATARIGVATADLFPSFSLTAAVGLQATRAGDLPSGGSGYWSIIPGLRLPIFNFGRIKSNIAVQNAREEQSFVAYEQTVLNSLREVEDALITFSENQKRREILADSVAANKRAVGLAQDLYTHGLTDFLSVLQAQRDLFQSEDALAESDRLESSEYIALCKALGGGWEIEKIAPDVPPAGAPGNRAVTAAPSR